MSEPTRETDARVAVAMGWTEVRIERTSNGHNLFDALMGVPSQPKRQSRYLIGRYTTDPALVVPMMERMAELAQAQVVIKRWLRTEWPWSCHVLGTDTEVWSADTANLACCAALLAVWERVKP
jgi:hypothetical protein